MNNLGFIETPYRKVDDGDVDVKQEHIYLSAEEEEGQNIAQSNLEVDAKGNFTARELLLVKKEISQ